MKCKFSLLLFFCVLPFWGQAQKVSAQNLTDKLMRVEAKLIDESGKPVSGASIIAKDSTTGAYSDSTGIFMLYNITESTILRIAGFGLKPLEVEVKNMKIGDEIQLFPLKEGETVEVDDLLHSEIIYERVEEMPVYPGGFTALLKYLQQIAIPRARDGILECGMSSRVSCRFTVEKDGSVTNAKVIKGVYPEFDAKALQLVKDMPDWSPGKQRGVIVRVAYTVPIKCLLQ